MSNIPLLDRVLETGSPVLLSTGMSPLAETDAAVARVRARGATVGVLQCTTAYPCPPERVGLNLIPVYRERYGCWVGLSDHSATIYPGLAGVALGLDVLEVHVALSREMFGPDVIASVTTAELRQLVDGIRFIERMRAQSARQGRLGARDRSAAASVHAQRRRAARRSPRGTVLGPDDLAIKKPGTGLPPERLGDLVGRKLARPVAEDQLLTVDDVEGLQ